MDNKLGIVMKMTPLDELTRCPVANALWVFACIAATVCIPTILGRLKIRASGIIVEASTHYEPRRVVYYTLKQPDGTFQTLISGPTDASLPRNLSVGTMIKKERWQLSYSADGQRVSDFPVGFYAGGLCGALAFAVIGIQAWLKSKE